MNRGALPFDKLRANGGMGSRLRGNDGGWVRVNFGLECGIIGLYGSGAVPMRIEAARPKTKIVCTLGPATSTEEAVRSLAEAGMSIARLNLSHGSIGEHRESLRIVRKVSADMGIPLGVMVDVPGIKYRTGPTDPGVVNLAVGDDFTLTSRDVVGSERLVSVSPPGIHRDAAPGGAVLLDDGLMELEVAGVEGEDVACTVVRGGRLTEGRGVATPGRSPSHTFPNEKAVEALEFAAECRADFVALSTVTGPHDIAAARLILEREGHVPLVISKIERSDAVDGFEKILAVSDAIMVARGDMGVEVKLARVPVLQKRLIALSNHAGKPRDHRHPDARIHDPLLCSDAGGGHGRCQRDLRRHGRDHAVGRDVRRAVPCGGGQGDG